MNKNTVGDYRAELSHTVNTIQGMFGNHVVNKKLNDALVEVEKVLMNVHQAIDERNERFLITHIFNFLKIVLGKILEGAF